MNDERKEISITIIKAGEVNLVKLICINTGT